MMPIECALGRILRVACGQVIFLPTNLSHAQKFYNNSVDN